MSVGDFGFGKDLVQHQPVLGGMEEAAEQRVGVHPNQTFLLHLFETLGIIRWIDKFEDYIEHLVRVNDSIFTEFFLDHG